VYKTDKDAEDKAGNDSGADDDGTGGPGGTGGGGKTYSVGGTVTGLQGTGLRLRNNDGNYLRISADGSFTFPEELADGRRYAVTVGIQPPNTNRRCTVENGKGKIAGANITDVVVSCVEPPEGPEADTDWAKVSSGFNYSCAIKTSGALFYWGGGSHEGGSPSFPSRMGHSALRYGAVPVQASASATD
jgi:hypothetical protein